MPSSASPQEQNKAVARHVFDEIFNQSKLQAADEIYACDFVNHGLRRNFSLAEDQAVARWEKTISPDLTMNVLLMWPKVISCQRCGQHAAPTPDGQVGFHPQE